MIQPLASVGFCKKKREEKTLSKRKQVQRNEKRKKKRTEMSVMLEQVTGDTHDHANMKDGFETEFVCAGVLIFFFKC